jgi:hypothetical protein
MMRAPSSISIQACSACAGDYEDPDRTAGDEFEDLLAEADEYEWRTTSKSVKACMAQTSNSTSDEILRKSQ